MYHEQAAGERFVRLHYRLRGDRRVSVVVDRRHYSPATITALGRKLRDSEPLPNGVRLER